MNNSSLASDPQLSVFVSANAGTGKTRALTHRVFRLLLNGVKPDSILCVTYTKAAAAEMQQRLQIRFRDGLYAAKAFLYLI